MIKYGYQAKDILSHEALIINLANLDSDQHEKLYKCLYDDLYKVTHLSLNQYNLHPEFTVRISIVIKEIEHIAYSKNHIRK
jgi:endonuclease IV